MVFWGFRGEFWAASEPSCLFCWRHPAILMYECPYFTFFSDSFVYTAGIPFAGTPFKRHVYLGTSVFPKHNLFAHVNLVPDTLTSLV